MRRGQGNGRHRTAAGALALALAVSLAGCSAAPPPTASPSPTTAVTIPSDGITLLALGFMHGPSAEFSIPQGSVLTRRVDQENVVTLVFAEPSGAVLQSYFVKALPSAAFSIEASADTALTFRGHGWSGSFIAGTESAVTLRRE